MFIYKIYQEICYQFNIRKFPENHLHLVGDHPYSYLRICSIKLILERLRSVTKIMYILDSFGDRSIFNFSRQIFYNACISMPKHFQF